MAGFKYTGNVRADALAKRNFRKLQVANPYREYVLASGANSVPHGFGKKPAGRRVVYQSAVADITDTSFTSTHWNVTASAAVTVRVEFVEAT